MLGILTADCAPVLFADTTTGVIGAAHAGWKGAVGGVLSNTVDAMVKLGATKQNITAAIGPCIHQASYEVGAEFVEKLVTEDNENKQFFHSSHFNLPAYVAHKLEQVGITRIDTLPYDTYPDEARFFSFRRTTHRSEKDYGRQLSAVMLST
jgi:YfiH family protein